MLKMISLLLITFSTFTFAQANSCIKCNEINAILVEIKSNKVAVDKTNETRKNVVAGPTQDDKNLESSLVKGYQVVCDFEESKANNSERLAMMKLVTGVYDLEVETAATADMYQCFHKNFLKSKDMYLDLAKQEKAIEKLNKILREGRPDSNDATAN